MKNKKVVIGLSKMTPAKKIVFGEGLELGLTNNPLIPNTAAMITLIHAATVALHAARAKVDLTKSPADYEAARTAEIDFDNAVFTVSLFVQGVADANQAQAVEVILSSGFKTRKTPEGKLPPGNIEKLDAEFTEQSGTILLKWKNAKRASFYDVYMTTNPQQGNWQLVDSIEGRKLIVTALTSGTRYYFRVVARNRAGKSDPSDIASQIAA